MHYLIIFINFKLNMLSLFYYKKKVKKLQFYLNFFHFKNANLNFSEKFNNALAIYIECRNWTNFMKLDIIVFNFMYFDII